MIRLVTAPRRDQPVAAYRAKRLRIVSWILFGIGFLVCISNVLFVVLGIPPKFLTTSIFAAIPIFAAVIVRARAAELSANRPPKS
jgi:hypothetical protein